MDKHQPFLQKVADDRYVVWFGTRRIGEVILFESKWYYILRSVESSEGYDTKEQAIKELIQATTKRLKKPADDPRINFCLPQERIDWFRDYALRQGKSMSTIIKDHIEELYQQDRAKT